MHKIRNIIAISFRNLVVVAFSFSRCFLFRCYEHSMYKITLFDVLLTVLVKLEFYENFTFDSILFRSAKS